MPRYRSHKEVWAHKIKDIAPTNANHDPRAESDGSMVITPEEDGYGAFIVDPAYVRKHAPQKGGYFVRYKDGYTSWSPAEAFEEGYTRVN